MAFRIKARIGAILTVSVFVAHAQTVTVRHRHWHGGGTGELRVTEEGISFRETKKKGHSRTWKYSEIQQLELSGRALGVLTYEDQKWKFGRDREYVFDQLPEGFAQTVYAQWRDRLDRRFIAAIPDAAVEAQWEIPAKLLGTVRGSQGVLRVGAAALCTRPQM